MDRPDQARRLAGVDQAADLGDGRAREPAELLDQLRERLDRLASNHPSARPERSEAVEGPVEGPARDASPPRRLAEAHQPRRIQAQHGDRPVGEAPARGDADRQPAPPALADTASGAPVSADPVRADPAQVDGGEPYRPWFVADVSADPWFIE